ncbi:MAG TPA: RNA methyltransferase [Thermoanaerobaculia bacterium]|nr:RNA methyltransferase [Thermoanaerobaculia bacterium]
MSRRLFGFHPVREALRHRPHEVAEVLLAAGRGGHRAGEIESLCARHGVPVRRVAAAVLRELAAGGVDNGFAANLRGDAIAGAAAGSDPGLQVLVEDVQDPRNLGALLRVCEGAGVRKVWIRDRGSAPLSAVAVKAAAGASEWLSIERVTNSARAIADAKAAGFWVYGLAVGGQLPWETDLGGPLLICLGGEADGLRQLTRRSCDGLLGLPMRGRVGSLNVATAAAAVLYEAVRQRTARGSAPRAGTASRGDHPLAPGPD